MYPAPNVSLQPKKKANLKNSNAQIQMPLLAPNVSLLEKKRIPIPTSRAATPTTDMANDGPFGVPSLVFDGRCKFWSPISCFRWQMKMGKINTRAALWPPPNQPPFVFDPETKHGRRQIPGGSRFKSFAAAVLSAAATKIDLVSSELSKNPTTPNLLS